MSTTLPPLRLTGAQCLRDGQLQHRSVAFAGGRLVRGPLPEVDLTGCLVLPGVVDLAAPGIAGRLATAVPRAARQLASEGVTTACLTQFWSHEGGERAPCRALALHRALAQAADGPDLRLCLLAETHHHADAAALIAAVAHPRFGHVAFSDSLDALAEMGRIDPVAFVAHAVALGESPADLSAAMAAARGRDGAVPRHLCTLAEAFDAAPLVYGSHRDADGETRERMSMIGARVALHPASRRAAAAARAMGCPVAEIASPHPDPAASALTRGDVPLTEAAFALADAGAMSLAQAWALISAGPADILRLPDRGRIAPGLRADLTILDAATRRVEATIVAGALVFATPGMAQRLGWHQDRPVAAE